MYAKLAFRNARRSAGDYLLYLTTLAILSALTMFSNLLAAAGSRQGFQASALPLLISLVMAALLNYVNGYMLCRRAKEFAAYLLLGMNRGTMAAVFFGESLLLGAGGFAVGAALGSFCYLLALSFLRALFPIAEGFLSVWGIAARDSLLYFIAVQALTLPGCLRKIGKLQIGKLMAQGRINQALKGRPRPFFWSVLCAVCAAADWLFVSFITGGRAALALFGTNAVIFPLVLGIWAFYEASFHWLAWLRLNRRSGWYRGNRLYLATQLLSRGPSNILLNTVLSVCLLFSVMTFSVGVILPNVPGNYFSKEAGLWMSFAEICMCVVFIAIYFSVLAVKQIVEAGENRRAFQIMAYLGKTGRQRRKLVGQEILLKYSSPAVMCLLLLLLCAGPLNRFLNAFLPADHLLLGSIGCFAGCFFLLYAGYALVAYRLCVKNIA